MKLHNQPIAIGQRFRQLDGRAQDQIVTVVRLDQDAMGFPRVVFQAPGGREVSAYAAQVEAAVVGGDLTPADDRSDVTILERRQVHQLAS